LHKANLLGLESIKKLRKTDKVVDIPYIDDVFGVESPNPTH